LIGEGVIQGIETILLYIILELAVFVEANVKKNTRREFTAEFTKNTKEDEGR